MKKMHITGFAVIAVAASFAKAAPTPIDATGWNQDMIIGVGEAAPGYTQAGPFGNTLYENGAIGNGPGLPTDGTLVTSSGTTFQFQSYTVDNSLNMLPDGNNNATGTLDLVTPGRYSELSFLMVDADHYSTTLTLHFAGGAVETVGPEYVPNWTQPAGVTSGPYGTNNYGGGVHMDEIDYTVTNQTSDLESIDFSSAGVDTEADVYAVSGVAVPEPASISLIGVSSVGLLARRRRKLVVA